MTREPVQNQRGRTLAVGFGVTTAMWVMCYLSMINPGLIIGELLFALILACLVAGGFIAGRHLTAGESAAIAGAKIGMVVAILNLLIAGAFLVDPQTHQVQSGAGWWIAGVFVASISLAAIGALIGSRFRTIQTTTVNWYNRFIGVAAITVFLLLITGGLVTGLQAGLAVPDWPNSFGHNMLLYPLSQMTGGIYYEHAHRLYGMLVGVTAIAVAASTFVFDQRGWVRAIAVAFLLIVCVQGVFGGTRVTEKSIALAIVHGMFGQIVFATIVALAAFTSSTWLANRSAAIKPSAKFDRRLTFILVGLLIVQLGLGAMYRHLGRSGNNPPEPVHVLWTHILVAVFVTITTVTVGSRACTTNREQPVLPVLGKVLLCLVGGQLLLGISAMIAVWSRSAGESAAILEVIVTTAHQVTGALLLAFATLTMLWTLRLVRSVAISEAAPQMPPISAQAT
jgi:heme A synthase